jgi:hypothetical protein
MAKSNKNGTPVKDKMKRIIIGICILALLPCLCWAAELTGRDIALRMDAVDTSYHGYMNTTLFESISFYWIRKIWKARSTVQPLVR